MDDYHAEASLWPWRFERQLKNMPDEVRQNYKRRWKPFMEYKSGRKLRDAMMFGRDGELREN